MYSPESIYFAYCARLAARIDLQILSKSTRRITPGRELYGVHNKAQGSRGIFCRSFAAILR
ncbi:hypothetical protein COO59_13350 [Mixta theicola]|uniref:Uncharacterized protein n=1 Tax=Mixta theicola TaxID=1458355 RepID=A0A2K1Q8A0_9GAMM|nr:hypothetical protein COO59_13350 [Mixta theicola]